MFLLSAALSVLPLLLCGEPACPESSAGRLLASGNDWVTIRNGQFYLSEQPFLPVGYNIWTRQDWEAEFVQKTKMGVSVFRGWMGWLDFPESEERLAREAQFEKILRTAQEHRVFLLVSVFDGCSYGSVFGQPTAFQKGQTVFNKNHGGPCGQLEEILTHPESIELAKARVRKIVDSWGNSSAIFGWDLMNELDMVPNPYPRLRGGRLAPAEAGEQAAWVQKIGEYIKDYELKKYGRYHLRTVSSYQPEPQADFFYNSPALDFVSTHMYHGSVIDPKDTISGALDAGAQVRHIVKRLQDNRPYLDTESGPILHVVNATIPAPPLQRVAKAYNNLAWAETAAGAAGPGFLCGPGLAEVGDFRAMRSFSSLWLKTSGPVRPLEITVSGAVGFGSLRGKVAIFWFVKDKEQRSQLVSAQARRAVAGQESVEFTISGLQNREYELIWHLDDESKQLGSTRVHGPSFSLKSVPFDQSIAGVIRPIN